ncbi:MAG: hypothetical protein V3V20_07025 [Algisphaera sp.]
MILPIAPAPSPPDLTTASPPEVGALAQVRTALATSSPAAPIIVDFDETLFLSNSTDHFLDHVRPRFLAAFILAVLAVLRPWRWGRSGEADFSDFLARDAWRVNTICLLLPWTLFRWKRQAADIMRELENHPLADLLSSTSRRIVVATYGMRLVVEPMLAGASVQINQLVAGPRHGLAVWRARGKAHAVTQTIGDDALNRAVVITDSARDQDLLDRAAHPVLTRWPGETPIMAQSSVYLPLVYLSRVKRQGRQEVLRQVLLDDFALVILAFAVVNPLTLGNLIGLGAAFLAFFCVYEIGYRENDQLDDAYAKVPHLSKNYHTRKELCRDPGPTPWAWALILTVVGAYAFHTPWLGAEASLSIFRTGLCAGLWVMLLVVTRATFGLYNRLDDVSRVFVFPWLQAAKTFGFALLLPTTLAGGLFMLAQVFRRWLHYACYRSGGRGGALPSHITRIMTYLLLALGIIFITGSTAILAAWHFWIIFAWLTLRGALQVRDVTHTIRWRGKPLLESPASALPPK